MTENEYKQMPNSQTSKELQHVNNSYAHHSSKDPLLWVTIGDRLKQIAQTYPDNEALVNVWKNERYTYQEFYAICKRAAKGFTQLGIKKGDHVGIWATNQTEWVITQFATSMIGAILVTINPSLREHELEYVLKDSECQTLILMQEYKTSKYLDMFYHVFPEIKQQKPGYLHSTKFPHLKNVILLSSENKPGMYTFIDILNRETEISEECLEQRMASLDPDDIINIQYTSGTTGFPKGACLTHHNIVNNAYFVGKNLGFSEKDRLCIPVPFYHCFGMVISNMVCVNYGATMVLPAEIFNALATMKAASQEQCTALHGVPTMFIAQLEHPDFHTFDFSHIRTGIIAGAPCPIEIMNKIRNLMGIEDITICYGLTEASPVTNQTKKDDPVHLRVETVGLPLQHTEIKIINPETGKVVPAGKPGEICVRGFQLMKQYYNKPKETKKTIDDNGWLHTGDLGTMNDQGYCRITGRLKDMIIRGGENIYPREIEEYLYKHPDIINVSVFGVPDEKYGEEIAVCIQVQKGTIISVEDIQLYCNGKISHQKIPKYIKFVEEFPMTVTGKIQKFKLRELYAEELGLNDH
ncbi:MAG: AMP-binding protein [Thermoplasmatota archaeon]